MDPYNDLWYCEMSGSNLEIITTPVVQGDGHLYFSLLKKKFKQNNHTQKKYILHVENDTFNIKQLHTMMSGVKTSYLLLA